MSNASRSAVTSELDPDFIAGLEDEAARMGLHPDAWWRVPPLRERAILRACVERFERYQAADYSWTRATELASELSGRSPTYLRVLVHRAREDQPTATSAA